VDYKISVQEVKLKTLAITIFIIIQLMLTKNVKVYAAFNTLLQENKIHAAVKQLNFLSQFEVDALIVQDLGIANIIKNIFII
jgi:putative protease